MMYSNQMQINKFIYKTYVRSFLTFYFTPIFAAGLVEGQDIVKFEALLHRKILGIK